MATNPHAEHRMRLRARFRNESLANFEKHTVIELLLTFGFPQKDSNEIAHDLLNKYGSLHAILEAPYEELIKTKGVKECTATLLKFIPELTAYYLAEKSMTGAPVCSAERAGEIFIPRFIGKINEESHMVSLDPDNNIIRFMSLPPGSVTMTVVNIRKVIAEAMFTNATSVIIAHNHMSAMARPSSRDRFSTKKIYSALSAADVKLLDHIIVSGDKFLSLRQAGVFAEFEEESQTVSYNATKTSD